jgi:hypothetical protein
MGPLTRRTGGNEIDDGIASAAEQQDADRHRNQPLGTLFLSRSF